MNEDELTKIEELVKAANQQLSEQADELPPETSAKLDRIRSEAVQTSRQSSSDSGRWHWSFAPALAASVLTIAVLITVDFNTGSQSSLETSMAMQLDDMSLINEDFELMEEDLEFYLWLEDEALASS